MRHTILTLVTALGLLLPAALSAQFGVAARAGTMGLGAEAALGLGSRVAIRGGIGFLPFEPSVTVEGIDFTLRLPETWYNLGADLYLAGGFRVGGGMLFRSDDPAILGEATEPQEIGGREYQPDEIGPIRGIFDARDSAPYVILGFGRHVVPGVGLFVDLGVAFLGEPDVSLEALDPDFPTTAEEEEFRQRLRQEEEDFEDDAPSYVDLWPILNLGLKIGLGR